jgi:hypothetical protein
MVTRAIVTSHPVVACDVCGRSLLRGESPDVFLAGGQRRTVCELCVPRASAEGWLREADDHAASAREPRGRRSGSLLGRLRQLREPSERSPREERQPVGREAAAEDDDRSEAGLYDFLDDGAIVSAESYEQELYIGAVDAEGTVESAWGDTTQPLVSHPHGLSEEAPTSGELKVARALEVFNAGEQPRRVAGVARSLGAPSVTVRPLQESGSTVAIVVAWELCWYRYQVDLGDEAAGSQLVAQGMELEELPAEDRLGNAAADERGELTPLPA